MRTTVGRVKTREGAAAGARCMAVLALAGFILVMWLLWRASHPARWIEFRRSGGVLGVNDLLVIFPDGTCVLRRGEEEITFVLSPQEQSRLRREAGLLQVPPGQADGGRGRSGADRMEYTLILSGKRYRFVDGEVPPSVLPLWEHLNDLLSRHLGPR